MTENQYENTITRASNSFLETYDEELIAQIELAEECGLTFLKKFDKHNAPIFEGDGRAWDYFNNGGPY